PTSWPRSAGRPIPRTPRSWSAAGGWTGSRRWRRALASPGCRAGQTWVVPGGDVVSSAPELARLTLNVAMVHHDASAAGGQRLVYGGHAIGLALAQAAR